MQEPQRGEKKEDGGGKGCLWELARDGTFLFIFSHSSLFLGEEVRNCFLPLHFFPLLLEPIKDFEGRTNNNHPSNPTQKNAQRRTFLFTFFSSHAHTTRTS